MPTEDQTVTQEDQEVVDQQQTDDAGVTPSGDEGGAEDTDFLVVNDRTRYRTREDAITAYSEAGQRINELSPYADIIERAGIDDPSTLQDILVDYQRLRSAAQGQVTREDKGQPASPARQEAIASDPSLSDADRKNIEYLKRLGYSPAESTLKVIEEKLKSLTETVNQKFGQFDSVASQLNQGQQQALIEQGQTHLASLLEERGYQATPRTLNFLENAITNWMQANSYTKQGNLIPGSPLDRFFRGGRNLRDAVNEGLEEGLAALNEMRIQADGKYQAIKQNKVTRTSKPLPKGSQSGIEEDKGGRKAPLRPGAGGLFQDPQTHDKAFELMKRGGRAE